MKIENKYHQVTKRDRISYLLKHQKNMAVTIEILEFLKANPDLLNKIKEFKDLQLLVWNLMIDRKEIGNDINVDKTLLKHFDKLIKNRREELGLEKF